MLYIHLKPISNPSLQVALPEDPTGAQRFVKRDASLALRNSEAGVVDQVLLTTSEAGQTFVKVRVRSICIPQVRPACFVVLLSKCVVNSAVLLCAGLCVRSICIPQVGGRPFAYSVVAWLGGFVYCVCACVCLL